MLHRVEAVDLALEAIDLLHDVQQGVIEVVDVNLETIHVNTVAWMFASQVRLGRMWGHSSEST